MEELIKDVKKKNREYSGGNIKFTEYCKEKLKQRKILEKEVISCLLSNNDLYYVKLQKVPFRGKTEERYKLVYKISARYSLIIVVSYHQKALKVINAIKTSKKAFKKWEQKFLR